MKPGLTVRLCSKVSPRAISARWVDLWLTNSFDSGTGSVATMDVVERNRELSGLLDYGP
jgi:hypothetical protein